MQPAATEDIAARLKRVDAVRADGTLLGVTEVAGELVSIDPRAQSVSVIARPGAGPREIEGVFALFSGPTGDTVFIRDNGRRWHTLTLNDRLVAERPAAPVGGRRNEACALSGGGFVTSINSRPIPKVDFLDSDFSAVRQFTHPEMVWPEASTARGRVWCGRGGYALMVADRRVSKGRLRFLLWDPVGDKWRLVTLDVPWTTGGKLPAANPQPQSPPPSEIVELSDFGAGRILVVIRDNDRRWQAFGDLPASSLYDVVFLLVDIQNSALLGSIRLDLPETAPTQLLFDRSVYRVTHTTTHVTLYRMRVQARPTPG